MTGNTKNVRLQNIIKKYDIYLKNIAYKITGNREDIIQEVYMDIYNSYKRSNGFNPNHKSNAKFKTWITRIAMNKSIDYLRKTNKIKKNVVSIPVEECTDLIQTTFLNPDEDLLEKEKYFLLKREIEDLPGNFSRAINLIYIEGKSYQEAAKLEEILLGTFKSRIHRGIEPLKLRLEKALTS